MKVIRYPERSEWAEILKRPAADNAQVAASVREIIDRVRSEGDRALRHYSESLDRAAIEDFAVTDAEYAEADSAVPEDLKTAINVAAENIERFHSAQIEEPNVIETTPGVFCWRKSVAIDKVGLYVPGGSAPLFSTVLMLAIPARIVRCNEVVICTPPGPDGKVHPAILYAAKLCGVGKVFKIGGAQAIAALAYGTETVPRVDKIFGPGNQYVTCAKQMVAADVAIDMPAGPSEVAVLADETCVPTFVAADLLSQAEHGPDSQVLLVSTAESVIEQTMAAVNEELALLPRRDTCEKALANSKAILVRDTGEALDLLNEYAPEHLILAAADNEKLAEKVCNAGSVFLGNYSCESAGDYASGTNHTLPTAGFARSMSGVSVDSFVKKITFQKLTRGGVRNLGPVIETMAAAEGLEAHRRAITVRMETIDGV